MKLVGYLDLVCAEMAKWSERKTVPDNPNAAAWISYGDAKGDFRKTELATQYGTPEAKPGDLDDDGDLDILDKFYNRRLTSGREGESVSKIEGEWEIK
jgi:hypothetical protein